MLTEISATEKNLISTRENYDIFESVSDRQSVVDTSLALFSAMNEWMKGNAFCFRKVNKVDFFLLVKCSYHTQNNTRLLGDMEFLFESLTRYLDADLNTRREIPYLRAPMYYSLHIIDPHDKQFPVGLIAQLVEY